MANGKEKADKQDGDGPSEAKQSVRCSDTCCEKEKARKGQVGFLRRKDNSIAVAIVVAVKDDAKGQLVTVVWFGESVLGRNASEKDVRVGTGKGCYNPSEKALEDAIKIEQSGLADLL